MTEQEEFEFRHRLEQEQVAPKFEVGGKINDPEETSAWTRDAIARSKRAPQNFAYGMVSPFDRLTSKVQPRTVKEKIDELKNKYIDEDSIATAGGKVLTTALITRGLGSGLQALGGATKVAPLVKFGEAIKTGGFSGGGLPTRVAGGATFGATASALEGGNPVIGGLAGAAFPLTGAGIKAASNLTSRLFGDPTKRAANILYGAADDPVLAAKNMLANRSPVPNEPITAGEASGDLGLMALQNKMRVKSPTVRENIDRMDYERRASREKYASSEAGTPKDIADMKDARDKDTGYLREQALSRAGELDSAPIISQIDALIANPDNAGKLSQAALNQAKEQIMGASKNGKINSRAAYAIRKDINDVISGKLSGDAGNMRYASGQLSSVKNILDDAIEGSGGSGWKKYLSEYADQSKPISQKEAMQEAYNRIKAGAPDLQGNEILSGPKLGNLLKDREFRMRLSPQQLQVLENIKASLNTQSKAAGVGISGAGSNTIDKLSSLNALENEATGMASTRLPIPFVRSAINEQVRRQGAKTLAQLEQALPDPQETLRLLEKARKDRLPRPVIQMLEKKARQAYPALPAGAGLLGSGD